MPTASAWPRWPAIGIWLRREVLNAGLLVESNSACRCCDSSVPPGLRDPWGATAGAALAARPRAALQVIPQTEVDGTVSNRRAHCVFCSAEDARATPPVRPRPNPDARGRRAVRPQGRSGGGQVPQKVW